MSGRATLTTVTSSSNMNVAIETRTRVHHLRSIARQTLKQPPTRLGRSRPPGGRTSRGSAGRSCVPGSWARRPTAVDEADLQRRARRPGRRNVAAVDRDFDRLAAGGVADVEDVAGGDDQRPRGERVRRDVADHVSLHAPGEDRPLVGEVVAGRAGRGGGDEAVAADVADLLAGDPVAQLGDPVVRAAGQGDVVEADLAGAVER